MSANQPEKKELQRARITAVVYSALTVLSLILFVYAFIQKKQAEANMLIAIELQEQLNACQEDLLELKANY